MPVGAARASEYAGWWAGNPPNVVTIDNIPLVTSTVYQTPSASFLQSTFADSTRGRINIPSDGSIDLTGYTSLSGFNNYRSTRVQTVYLDWPSSSITSGVGTAWANQLTVSGTTFYFNPAFGLANSNTQLEFNSGGPASTNSLLTGSYTNYITRWLTAVASTAETSSVFSNWTGGSSGGSAVACRTCIYDTVTGERLSKTDTWGNGTWPDIATIGSTLPTGGAGSTKLESNFFSNQHFYYMSNAWFAIGTCFDPESSTDTSWRTTRPSATIDGASAWYNLQMPDYASPSNYYILQSDMDRYSQPSNYISNGFTSTQWSNSYSTTLFAKDST